MNDNKVKSEQLTVNKECDHKGIKHGVVVESHCTIEKIDIVCDKCSQIIKTVVET